MTQINYPKVPIQALFKGSARIYPSRVALVDGEDSYTYEEIYSKSLKFAQALHRLGIEKGDVVCLHLTNSVEYLVAYYGIIMSGATYSPANPLLSEAELTHQLNDCSARIVVTTGATESLVTSVVKETAVAEIIVSGESKLSDHTYQFKDLLEEEEAKELDLTFDPDVDIAHLAYTGGTTGRSKGVMLTHANVVANIIQATCFRNGGTVEEVNETVVLSQNPSDEDHYLIPFGTGVTLTVTPWYHAMGTIGYLNNILFQGATIVLLKWFEPRQYLSMIEQHQATTVGGAAPLFHALVTVPNIEDMDFTCVKQVISGASPIAQSVLTKLGRIFPNAIISEGYGLTEASMMLTANPCERSARRKIGSVGIPTYDTKVILMNESNQQVSTGQVGEVCAKGPQVMQGYLNRLEETEIALRDGWLRTGDLGTFDEDGYLYIVDRKKDMILYKGYNVYPGELEDWLYRYERVSSAAVVGVPHELHGELPVAFVVIKDFLEEERECLTNELLSFVNEQVTPYKKIRELVITEELPTSGAGKILKRELKQQAKVLASSNNENHLK
ncbi:AMP-binding protein [Geomicrobium sediminis]|uniref:Long-chain acyl-CoA synthetase n=1 Tax=Geomicrobium sediminis TaxID=1347788 RepID=A0ABS2PAL0_9BACL|nr:long-chain acyl-CoA synthetase [Geomicrobium sediminis]